MSPGQSLHFAGANALLEQLTEHLRQEEGKVLQVPVQGVDCLASIKQDVV